ncbi:choloylglycine hydrolase [Rhizobium sp. R72]|uniref:C45 family autoproteolytic acyltransferase/hydolase n=1 Tax=unclassified Rhizobium TaxID=2613769 RepID=UPI000B52F5C0|nr:MULTISPECIES: C45 family peptidase [unclassified Rhizobium]OWW02419.1 choloylglycine hydrolase [Rhizobium sp. R72]OWW02553.1 choloylglycine hydrolase [Rhizobium sp. R711]
MPIITLRGSPSDRGRQHGTILRGMILEAFKELRRSTDDASWSLAQGHAAACIDQLSGITLDLVAELAGIAEATELPLSDLFLLSAFEYFAKGRTGCTSAGLVGDNGAVVAQNWDARVGGERDLAVFIHEGADLHLVTIASAGTLGWVGMNGHGLALVNNDLILDTSKHGLPSLVIRRMMLAQTCVEDAIGVLRAHPHMSGRCFLLGDAQGSLRAVEVGPAAGVTDRAFRSIVHTNHPLFPKPAMWEDVEEVARHYPSSRSRLRAARQFVLTDIDDVAALLRDRTGAPDAICKSPSAREQTGTAFSVIFDCSRREAMVAIGRPDQTDYRRITVLHPAHV